MNLSERNDDSQLWANTDNARLKGADMVARATVRGDLLVEVTNRSEENLFGDELRSAPVQMPIDAVLVVGAGVNEVVGETSDGRKFVAEFRIKVAVAATEIGGT